MRAGWGSGWTCGFGSAGGCGAAAVRVRGRSGVTVTGADGGRGRGLFVPPVPLTHSCRSFYKTHLQQPPQSEQLCRVRTSRYHTLRDLRSASLQSPAFAIFTQRRLSSTSSMSELKWPSARVRKAFFDYMEQRGHTIGMPTKIAPPSCQVWRSESRWMKFATISCAATRTKSDGIQMLQIPSNFLLLFIQ